MPEAQFTLMRDILAAPSPIGMVLMTKFGWIEQRHVVAKLTRVPLHLQAPEKLMDFQHLDLL